MASVRGKVDAAARAASQTKAAAARADLAEARNREKVAKLTGQMIKAAGDYSRTSRGGRPRTANGFAPLTNSGQFNLDRYTHQKLRAECQRLMRRNPVARAMVQRQVDHAVGRGMGVQSRAVSDVARKEHEAAWGRWVTENEFHATLRLVYKAKRVDGDVLAVMIAHDDASVGVQVIEGELIKTPSRAAVKSAERHARIVEGVEHGPTGRVVGYWVCQWAKGGAGVNEHEATFVEAARAFFLRNQTRVSAVRGEPGLVSVIDALESVDKFINATVIGAQVAACTALVIKSQYPALMENSLLASMGGARQSNADGSTPAEYDWRPGAVLNLPQGADASTVSPAQPGPQFDSFTRMMFRMCGSDQGLPLELSLMDFSQANFASAKLAYSAFYSWLDFEQDDLKRLVRWVYARVISAAMLSGEVVHDDDFDAVEVMPPARPPIDVNKEAAAAIRLIGANLLTKRSYIEEMGGDWEEVLAQRGIESRGEAAEGVTPIVQGAAVPAGSSGNDDSAELDLSAASAGIAGSNQ